MNQALKDAYKKGNLVLFVGAGVSGGLGLPTWSGLIDEIARQLGYDPDVFKSYGNSLALAEYYRLKFGGIGRLRSWMDREWHQSSIDVRTSVVHKLIAQGNFGNIYTTNYDRWLERAHEAYGIEYAKVSGVADLVLAREGGCPDFCVRGPLKLVHGGGRRLRRTTDAVGKLVPHLKRPPS
jgi:hypothetical protein